MGGKGCRQPFGDKWGNWNVHGVSDNTKLVFIFVGTRVVSVGCYITHHRLGVLKQQFISHSSGGRGGSDIKVPDSLSGEDLLPDAQTAVFSLCSHVGKG